MDRGTWRATVHGVAESWTRLKRQSTHSQTSGDEAGLSREVQPGAAFQRGLGAEEARSSIRGASLPAGWVDLLCREEI